MWWVGVCSVVFSSSDGGDEWRKRKWAEGRAGKLDCQDSLDVASPSALASERTDQTEPRRNE